MRIQKIEDIVAWQKAKELTVDVYKEFKNLKDYNFKDQIERASVSVMNNVAEGFERGTDKEFKHFLYIAKGSCGEVRSMLELAKELNYLEQKTYEKLQIKSTEISKILAGFIKAL